VTDTTTLAAWRLLGEETVAIDTETPEAFARAQRAEIPLHLDRIAVMLDEAAKDLRTGNTTHGNLRLAAGSRDLGLVLELDQHLSLLDASARNCAEVAAVVERIGPRLTAAEAESRWDEVASLLTDELVPAIRAGAAG